MTSERIASSLARPPALRITWASPSARPAYFAGSSRASMQVRMAKLRAGGSARSLLAPNAPLYFVFASRTSVRILLIEGPFEWGRCKRRKAHDGDHGLLRNRN